MLLSRDVLKELILNKQLITEYEDIDKQLTANGFDIRLGAIVEVLDGGKLSISKADIRPPKLGKAVVLPGFEKRLEGYDIKELIIGTGVVKLDSLKPYLVIPCEFINTPNDLMFHINARTSLFRITQSLLGCTIGEAGFKGFLTFMLFPVLDCEIELGARIAQLSFSELKGEAHYEQQKETNYQGGKLF